MERCAKLAIVELIDAQAPEGAQPVDRVVEPFRELERGRPAGAGLSGAANPVHQRPAKRPGKLHAWSRGRGIGAVEARQRPLDPLAALTQQRQLHPKRHNRDGQRHADLRVTLGRERPIETGAHIVEMPAVNGQPLGLRQQLTLRFGMREHAKIVFGMTSGDLLKFTRAVQLLATVQARGVKQTVA